MSAARRALSSSPRRRVAVGAIVVGLMIGGLWLDPFDVDDSKVDAAGVAWTKDAPGVDYAGSTLASNPSSMGRVSQSSNIGTSKNVPSVDPTKLYAIDGFGSQTSNVVFLNTADASRTQQFAVQSQPAVEQNMLALDSGLGAGQEGFYGWYRGPMQSQFAPDKRMPLWYYKPGANTANQVYLIPDPTYFGFNSSSWGTSGGVVNQRTGLVYLKQDMVQYLGPNANMRLAAFDPKQMATYWSGPLVPETSGDNLWTSPLSADYTTPGFVAPGMAITASGDLVLLVKGTSVAISASNPINTTGKAIPAGSVGVSFLVKVHPSLTTDNWTYSVMKMVSKSPKEKKNIELDSMQSGMAFSDGMLYLETNTSLVAIDPVTGYWNYVGEINSGFGSLPGSNPAPQNGYYLSSFASAQTAAAITGQVFQASTPKTYNPSDSPVGGVRVGLYEQNPAKGYNQPTLIGSTVTDGSGEYTFIVPDSAEDGSVTYLVRLVQPQMNGQPATLTAGAVMSGVGLSQPNSAQLVCANGTTLTDPGSRTVVSGPCLGPKTSPALETVGATVDPATFGAYGLVTMRDTWSDSTIDFTLLGVDLVPPEPPVILTPVDQTVTNNPVVTITGTGEAAATLTVSDGTKTVCTTTVASNGSWSCDPLTLGNGTYTFTAYQTDPSENQSDSASVTVTIDTTAPDGPVITTPADGTVTNNPDVVISGTGEPAATLTVSAGSTVLCTTTVKGDGSWTCGKVTLADGTYRLVAAQRDQATNLSEDSDPVNLTVDTAKPYKPSITNPADGTITNYPVVVVAGWGESGDTVTARDASNAVVCTAIVTDDKWACPAKTFADGTYSFTATQTDPAGNVSDPSNTVTITIDTVSPAAPQITQPADNTITTNPVVTISGTGESGTTVKVSDADGLVCTATVVAGAWACDPVTFVDGSYLLTAVQTDAAGNSSDPSNSVHLTVDTAAPDPPVITEPADGTITNDPIVMIKGTGETGGVVTVSDAKGTVCTATVQAGVWECDPVALGDGTYTFTAIETDQASNVSDQSNSVTITIDTNVPAPPVILSPVDPTVTNNPVVTISGTGESGTTVTVSDDNGVVCSATVVNEGWACAPVTMADGTYVLAAVQVDQAGNVSQQSNSVTVTIDTQSPAAPVITAPADGTVTNNPMVTISGTGESGATVTVRDTTGVVCTAVVASGRWACDPVFFADGEYRVNASQTDPAGNNSGLSSTVDFIVDTSVPAAPVILAPADGTVTNNPMVTISGTGESGATVTVSDNDGEICTAPVTAGQWECAPVLLGDGTYTLVAHQVDPAQNKSDLSPPVTITVDTTKPAKPVITSPDDGLVTNNPVVTIGGTGESGATVTVSDESGVVCTATVTNGQWQCDPVTLADGTYLFTADQVDAAGNESEASDAVAVTIDTGNPAPPVITAPADGTVTNNPLVTIEGRGESGATVTVSDAVGIVCRTTVSGGIWFCPEMALRDGTYVFTAVQADPAGNKSGTSDAVTITIDTTKPALPVIEVPADGTITNNPSVVVSGTGEPGATVAVSTDIGFLCKAVASSGGKWSCAPVLMGDGTYLLTANQSDVAGNDSGSSDPVTLTIDTAKPDLPVITAPADGTVTNNPSVTISGTGESGAAVTVRDAAGVVCTATVADGRWACDPVTLADGTYTFTASQTDPAGNDSGSSQPVTITVDTVKPELPVITRPADQTVTNNNVVTIAGTGESGALVTVRDAAGVVCTATVADGQWACDPVTLADGTYTFTASQADAAGNDSGSSQPVTITIDTGEPTPPVITSPLDGTVTNDPVVTIKGTGESGATVTVSDAAGVVCTTTVADGKWSCEPMTMADGTYTFTAVQADPAGNKSDSSDPVTITVDTVKPAGPVITAPADGTVTNNPVVTISGTGESGATVTVNDAAGLVCTATVTNGKWSCAPVTLGDGTYTFTASQSDPAGNKSDLSDPVTIIIDTVKPAVPVITAPVDGTVTNNPSVVVSGTGESGATVTVSDSNGFVCKATVADGKWSCDAVTLADGTYTLTASQSDPAGNGSGESDPVTITIDTGNPVPPVITSPADQTVTNNPVVTIIGTGESGALVTVSDAAGVVCTATVADGKWSCAPVTLADGTYTFTASQADPAGNKSESSDPVTITIDTVKPAVPVITAPADGTVTNNPSVVVSGTGESGATVTVSDDSGVVCTATVSDGKWTCAPVTLEDGTYTFTATQSDAAGNKSGVSDPVTITVDTGNPVPPVITAPADQTVTNNPVVTIEGSGESGATVTVSDANGVVCTATVTDGKWTCAPVTLADGTYTFTAEQADPAGNKSGSSDPVTVTIDTAKPIPPVITAPADGTVTNNPVVTISGTGESNATVTVRDAAGVVCTATVVDGKWSCAPVTLADGTYTFTAGQTDPAGNDSGSSDPVTITVDTVKPAQPVITAPADQTVTNNPVVTITGTGESGASVTVSDAAGVVCTATVVDGKWSCAPVTLADGTYTFTATQSDPAGNKSGSSDPVTITIDTGNPVPPVITAPADQTVTNNPVVTITGTGESGATVSVSDDAGVVCTAVVSDGTWSCAPVTLADGTYVLKATQSDPAGNKSDSSDSVTITIDTAKPAAPVITAPANGTVTNDPVVTVSGTGESGAAVTVSDANGVVCTATVSDGKWSCSPVTLPDGTYTLVADQSDPAGNKSGSSDPVTITIDTAKPLAPVITSPADQTVTSNNVVTISGTGESGATVSVSDDAGVVCTATVADGKWSCAPVTLADGTYTFTASQSDPAGNVSGWSDPVTITIDTVKPVPPVITNPADGTVTNIPVVTISGTGESGATVTVYDEHDVVCTAQVVAGAWSCAPVTLADGTYVFTASQADAAGNNSGTSDAVTVTVDTGNPVAPVITSPVDGTVTNIPVVTISGTGESGATVTVSDEHDVVCTAQVVDGHWSCAPVTLADGTYTFMASQADAAGNNSGTSDAVTITVDTAKPVAPVITSPSDGTVTNNPVVTISGTGESNAAVTVSDAKGVVCTATVSAGKWSCAPVTLADGTYTFTADQIDLAGNASGSSDPVTITIDTVKPAAPVITSPADQTVTNNPVVTIVGTGESGASVTVSDANGVVCTATVADGKWSCAPVTLADGTYTFVATQSDAAGNGSGESVPVTITVDTGNPVPPVITSPADQTVTNNPVVTIGGTGESGATVTVSDAAGEVCTATVADGKWSCAPVTLADGTYVLTATQSDPAGNASGASDPVTITVDTVKPAGPVITAPADGTVTNDPVVTIVGTGESGATVTVKDAAGVVCTATVVDGKWSCSPVTLADGTYTFTAAQSDAAGNGSDSSDPVTITIDTAKPVPPVITAPADQTVTNNPVVTISGTGESGATVTVSDAAGVVCTATVADGKWACAPVTLADGTYTLTASQTDPAGNASGTSDPVTITVDTGTPVPPVITAPADGTVTNNPVVTISGTGESGATVSVSDDAGVVCTATVADGKWLCDPVTLADGTYLLKASQTDPAGNASGTSEPVTITVDTAKPAAPVITAPVDGTVTNNPVVTISGTGESGATVSVSDDAGVVCTAKVADGKWSCDPVTLADGTYTFIAKQTDPAGNDSGSSDPVTVTVDTGNPVPPVITVPADQTVTNNPIVTISGTGESNATVTVNDASGVVCTATVSEGKWSCDPVTLADGTYTFTATQSDPAGNNSGKSAPVTITIDTAKPVPPVITTPADQTVTNNPVVTIAGTGESAATVTVSDANGVVCTATVSDGKWSCEPVTLADGTYTFTAAQTDPAGNASGTSDPVTITIDTAKPVPPVITSPADQTVTSNNVVTISGTGESGATVTVSDEAGVVCTATVSAGKWTCQPVTLDDGTYTFTAKQTDPAGNDSGSSDPVTVTVDTGNPEPPVITSPADGTVTNNPVVTITGTGESNATVTVSDANGVVCTATVADGKWSCEPVTLADGTYTFTAKQADPAGNNSGESGTVTITIDTAKPVPPVITSPADQTVTNNPVVTISGTGESGATVTVTDDAGVVCTATVADGKWSCSPVTLADGTYTFTAKQADPAGNDSGSSDPVTITVDTGNPVPPVITSPADGTVTNNPVVTISGTGESNATVTVSDASGVVCTATVADGKWSCSPVTLDDGTYTFTAKQTDPAGNGSGVSDPVTITVDTAKPVPPVITSPADGTVTNNPVVTISGTGESGATVTVTDDAAVVCTATVADGKWSCSPVTLADGTYTFTAKQTDPAGNGSGVSDPVTITVDTAKPVPPVITSPADGTVTNNPVVTISGTGESGAMVTVSDGQDVVCTATVADGKWSCVPVTLEDGTYTFTAIQSDAAGNNSGASDPVTITVDTGAPVPPVITSPADGTVTNIPVVTITGTGESGSSVTVSDSTGTVCTAQVVDGQWSCAPVTLADGTYTLTASQTDPAGNGSGTSGPVTITIDTATPVPPVITSPADGTVTNNPVVTITGTGESGTAIVVSNGQDVVCTATVADGKWSCAPVTLADGTYHLVAVQTDQAGNRSDPSNLVTVSIDTAVPAAPVITHPADQTVTNNHDVTISGTGESGARITVVDRSTLVCTATVADGQWACDMVTLPDGTYLLSATQTDPATNVSAGSNQVTLTIDTGNPSAPVITSPAPGTVTNNPDVVVAGTGESGATVTVTDQDGNKVCTTTVANGQWTCPAVTLPDGTYDLSASQTDPAGNTSPDSDKVTVTIDTSAPSAPVITSPSDGTVTNNPSVTITGTGESGAVVTVTDQSGSKVCTTTVADGMWSCAPVTLPDGTYSFTASQTDPAGNKSPDSAAVTVTVDTGNPVPPVITSPAPGTVTNNPDVIVAGTGEDGATVTVTDQDGNKVCTTTVANGQWTCPAVTLPDGTYDLSATQTDPAGNTSPDSDKVTITIDTTKPNPPTIDTADETTIGGTGDEPGDTVVVKDGEGSTLCTTTVQPDGTWSCQTPEGTPSGPITVTVTDPAGNTSDPSTGTLDATALDAPVITSPATGVVTANPQVVISGTSEQPDGTMVTVANGAGTPVCTAMVLKGKWSCSVSLPDGTYSFTATQTNAAGTRSPDSNRVTIMVDTTAPAKPVITTPAPDTTTNNPNVVVAGTGESGATVTVTDESGNKVCTTTVANGQWTCPAMTLPDGAHDFVASQTDPAGNQSPDSDKVTITIDTTAPAKPVITSPTPGTTTNNPNVVVAGTGESGATVTVTDQTGNSVCTTTVANGQWQCPSVSLPDGTYDFVASQTDPAGNQSPDSDKVTIMIDTTAPAKPVITSPADGSVFKTGTFPVTGTGESGAAVTVIDQNGNKVCTATVVNGRWSCQTSALADGSYLLKARQTDPAGNRSADSDPVGVRIDTVAPNPPTIDSANKDKVTGHSDEPGGTVNVITGGGDIVCTATVQPDGSWSCDVPPNTKSDDITVTVTDEAGNVSGPTTGQLDTDPPRTPVLYPSNGSEIHGKGEPGSIITITDGNGKTIPGCLNVIADSNGNFGCTPTTPVPPGTTVVATATDAAGNVSGAATITIQSLVADLEYPVRQPGQVQIATGMYFNPGEIVTFTMSLGDAVIGTSVAKSDGTTGPVTFDVPDSAPDGTYAVTLTGSRSGPILGSATAYFVVQRPAAAAVTLDKMTPLPPEDMGLTVLWAGSVVISLAAVGMGIRRIRIVRRWIQAQQVDNDLTSVIA